MKPNLLSNYFVASGIMVLFLSVLIFSSCAHKLPPLEKRLSVRLSKQYAANIPKPGEATKDSSAKETGVGSLTEEKFREIAPLKLVEPEELKPSIEKYHFSSEKMVVVEADGMPIPDFIHYVFSDLLGVNYVMDDRIKTLSTLISLDIHNEIAEQRLFDVVREVLHKNNLSVYFKDDVFYIWAGVETKGFALGVGSSERDIPTTLGQIQQLIPIRYADVNNIRNLIPTVKDTYITVSTNDNILVVRGTREQVVDVLRVVNALDRPAMRGRFAGIIKLSYWNPEDMVAELRDILTQEGVPVTKASGKKGLYFTALDRWGTILFFAHERQWIDRVKYWVDILDVAPERDESRYFLYFPQNSKALEIAESLGKILGISGEASLSRDDYLKEPESKKGEKKGEERKLHKTELNQDGTRIAVDESRNALIIYSTPEKYDTLKALITKLDIMPVQVLIEASIAEVTLTDGLQYGIEWYLKNTDGDQTSVLQTLGGMGMASGGLDYSIVTDSKKFQLLLNALSQEGMIKILSSPRLTVRDSKSASIIVGTEVPVITSESTTSEVITEGTSGIVRSIQYRRTGVSLTVTPSVHAKGVITLEIAQEVSEAQTNTTSDISSPMILNRSLSTEVSAADGQTIIIGGLIKENRSETVIKVPVLGDIPIFGYLFRTKSQSVENTELIVMITPRIIRNTQQIDEMRESIINSLNLIEAK
ncbi:MAG: type II secretion system secretin GspD [Deltaproteobacteria bacterium]|nr:type II secretion system secretin GspD [Deltaproteobacteria bacterium]